MTRNTINEQHPQNSSHPNAKYLIIQIPINIRHMHTMYTYVYAHSQTVDCNYETYDHLDLRDHPGIMLDVSWRMMTVSQLLTLLSMDRMSHLNSNNTKNVRSITRVIPNIHQCIIVSTINPNALLN